jgi:hypothetical protein
VLDRRGMADRFLAEGQAMQVQAFAGIPVDISDFPTRHNYVAWMGGGAETGLRNALTTWFGTP